MLLPPLTLDLAGDEPGVLAGEEGDGGRHLVRLPRRVMTLHRALVAAARVPVLDAMHQTVVAVLRGTLTRATFIDGYEPLLRHSTGDPRRSPGHASPRP